MDSSARGRATDLKPLVNTSTTSSSNEPLVRETSNSGERASEAVTSPSTDSIVTNQPVTKIQSSSHRHSQSPTPPPSPPPAEETVPESTSSDPAWSNATKYPWLYMAKTLEACFNTAEEASKEDPLRPQDSVTREKSGLSSQPTLTKEAGEFYDELAIDSFTESAPKLMQAFLSHGDICARVEAEALNLAIHGDPDPDEDAPLQVYMAVLERLEELLEKALELESNILEFTKLHSGTRSVEELTEEEASARQKVLGVFERCSPVLRARISNLRIAQELTDGAQENLSITLRMESLGL